MPGDRARADDGGRSHALDRSAIALSALCLAHCLALPVVIAAAPAMARVLPDQPWVHPAILATAAPLAAVTLWRGWRHHRSRRPAAIGLAGIVLLAAGVAVGDGAAETALTVAGGLALAGAHALNWRRTHAGHAHRATGVPRPPRAG